MKIYLYIYYKLYSWAVNINRKSDIPEFTAFFTLTFLVYINTASIVLGLKAFFDVSFNFSGLSSLDIIGIAVLILLPQYFVLLHNSRYKKIVEEFNNESRIHRITGNFITWFYIIGSLIFLFTMFFTLMKQNQLLL